MDIDLERGSSRSGTQGEGGISINAGFLLGVLAVVRLAAFGLNWWLYCNEGEAGHCYENTPDVSTVGGHDGAHAKFRFASAVITTLANDLCNWLVLSAAFARPTLAKQAPCPAAYFKFLLVVACTLDGLQAIDVDGAYHWALIQVAGAFMIMLLLLLFLALWKELEPRNRCCLILASLLYTGLLTLLVSVLVLYHIGFEGGRSLWARLEYTALVVYTAVLLFLGLTLPDARVVFRMMARVEVLPIDSSERTHACTLPAATVKEAASGLQERTHAWPLQAGTVKAAASGRQERTHAFKASTVKAAASKQPSGGSSSRLPDVPNPKPAPRRAPTKIKRARGL